MDEGGALGLEVSALSSLVPMPGLATVHQALDRRLPVDFLNVHVATISFGSGR